MAAEETFQSAPPSTRGAAKLRRFCEEFLREEGAMTEALENHIPAVTQRT
jgi:hypothetical protein